jgi:hypothetical protein
MQKNKTIPAPPSHAARSLAAMFRLTGAPTELTAVLAAAQQSHLNIAPFDLTQTMFVEEQIYVVPQMMWPKPRTSKLFAYLTEYPDDVHLIVDAYKTGREALYFCRLSNSIDDVYRWLRAMQMPTLLVNHTEGEIMMAAPAHSFIA